MGKLRSGKTYDNVLAPPPRRATAKALKQRPKGKVLKTKSKKTSQATAIPVDSGRFIHLDTPEQVLKAYTDTEKKFKASLCCKNLFRGVGREVVERDLDQISQAVFVGFRHPKGTLPRLFTQLAAFKSVVEWLEPLRKDVKIAMYVCEPKLRDKDIQLFKDLNITVVDLETAMRMSREDSFFMATSQRDMLRIFSIQQTRKPQLVVGPDVTDKDIEGAQDAEKARK